MKIKKLPLKTFYWNMTRNLKDSQTALWGFRNQLINKMERQWKIESYRDLAEFPFSKLLVARVDVGFLGNLELQMTLHGLTLNIDVENIPRKYNKKLDAFYEWMEEHEDLIHWNDLPEFPEQQNIHYYKSKEDYLRDVFRGLLKEK